MTQFQMVINHLKKHKHITQLEATLKYRILRLGAIIFSLKKLGYKFETKHIPTDTTGAYARYYLLKRGRPL